MDDGKAKTPDERRLWMLDWCGANDCTLELNGEVGFGRECVGITADGNYPDWEDWSGDGWHNVAIWTPEDAYHKHPCVAVLGTGEEAERQLYEWLVWFDEHGFTVDSQPTGETSPVKLLLGQGMRVRMVQRTEIEA